VTCAEFKENVAALALGALEPDEQAACEAHLAETERHEGCLAELRRATEAAALLAASAAPIKPGEHVWNAIAAEVAAGAPQAEPGAQAKRDAIDTPGAGNGGTRPRPARVTAVRPATRSAAEPKLREPRPPRERRGGWREAVAWTLAAAAGVAVAVLGAQRRSLDERFDRAQSELALSRGQLSETLDRLARVETDLQGRVHTIDLERAACLRDLDVARISLAEKEAALDLLGTPGTQLVQLAAQGDVPYRASALVNSPREEGLVLASALAPQEGKDYQLWLIRGDQKISGGLLPTDAAGLPTLARISRGLLSGGAPDAFAITVEPAGGMPQPTGPIVLVGKIKA
jgi:anti-sigma-K factor RskA